MRPALLTIASLVVLLGCGDEDTSSSKERVTEIAYEQACAEAEDLLVSQYSGSYFVQALCAAAAVEGNSDAKACGAQLDACINNPPAEIQDGIDAILGQAGCALLSVDTTTCSSTLGAVEACLGAIDQQVSGLKYTLTCAAAGQMLEDWNLLTLPDECQFEADC